MAAKGSMTSKKASAGMAGRGPQPGDAAEPQVRLPDTPEGARAFLGHLARTIAADVLVARTTLAAQRGGSRGGTHVLISAETEITPPTTDAPPSSHPRLPSPSPLRETADVVAALELPTTAHSADAVRERAIAWFEGLPFLYVLSKHNSPRHRKWEGRSQPPGPDVTVEIDYGPAGKGPVAVTVMEAIPSASIKTSVTDSGRAKTVIRTDGETIRHTKRPGEETIVTILRTRPRQEPPPE